MSIIKIAFIGVFVLCCAGIIFLSLRGKGTIPQKQEFSPTPTPIPVQNNDSLTQSIQLLHISPESNTKNVSLTAAISLTFSKKVTQSAFSFSITPSIPVAVSTNGNVYTIAHDQPFSPNTTYTYFITIEGLPAYTLSFTTVGDGVSSGTTDFSNDIQNELNKHINPDVYLAQYTPHNTDDFFIISNYSNQTSSYSFVVTYFTDLQKVKSEFLSWTRSLGLTDQQIEKLHIDYIGSTPGS